MQDYLTKLKDVAPVVGAWVKKYWFYLFIALVFLAVGKVVFAAEPCQNYFVNNTTGKKVCLSASLPDPVVHRVYERATVPAVYYEVNGAALDPRHDFTRQPYFPSPDRNGYLPGVTYRVQNFPGGLQARQAAGSREVTLYRR